MSTLNPGMVYRRPHARPVTAALAAVLALSLAACESTGEDIAAAPETAAASDDKTAQAVETSAPPAGGVAALTPEPVKATPEPAIDDDPQQLYGMDSNALGELLGEPSLVRNEAPAEIWQYRSQTCVFDIFLYQGADRPRVTYIEARDDAAQRIDARACLNEILRARMGLEPLG